MSDYPEPRRAVFSIGRIVTLGLGVLLTFCANGTVVRVQLPPTGAGPTTNAALARLSELDGAIRDAVAAFDGQVLGMNARLAVEHAPSPAPSVSVKLPTAAATAPAAHARRRIVPQPVKPRTPRATPDFTTRFEYAKGLLKTSAGVAAREAEVNVALAAAYSAAGREPPEARLAAETRVALMHFVIAWRRQSMQAWHTKVPGLEADPDCQGDLFRDRLLESYTLALFDTSQGARHQELVALIRLARQAACLSARQIAELGDEALAGFAEVSRLLARTGRDQVGAMLVQILSQPFLFFYDVDKRRGAASGWERWFADNRGLLIEGLRARRQPAGWRGLWLYDRRTARLLQFQPAAKLARDGDIDLSRFFWSLGRPEQLGFGACSFAELALRARTSGEYRCRDPRCGPRMAPGGGAPAAGSHLGLPSGFPQRGKVIAGPPGLAAEDCNAPAGSGSSGGSSDGAPTGGACDRVSDLGAGTRAALAVECASSQVVRPGTEGMKCLTEAIGGCQRAQGLIAGMTQSDMTGVKTGKLCGLAQTGGDGIGVSPAGSQGIDVDGIITGVVGAIIGWGSREGHAIPGTAQEGIDFWLEAYESATSVMDRLDGEIDQLIEDLANSPSAEETARVEGELEEKWQDWQEANDVANQAEDSLLELGVDVNPDNSLTEDATGTARCVDETSCNDACTGIERETRQALDCVSKALDPGASQSYKDPIAGCDPSVCDPVEPSGGATRASCFDSDDLELTTPKQCWLVDCARDQGATAAGSGCTCGPALDEGPVSDPRVVDFCQHAHCASLTSEGSGAGVLTGASCGCSDGSTSSGLGKPSEISPGSLPTVPPLLNTNPAAKETPLSALFAFAGPPKP